MINKTNLTILFFIFMSLSLIYCSKGKTKFNQDKDSYVDIIPEDSAIDERISSRQMPGSSGEKCFAENYKLEAQRRMEEMLLEPLFNSTGLIGLLYNLLKEIPDKALKRNFDEIFVISEKTYEEMKKIKPDASENDLKMIKNILNQRTGAFASCMAIASKDITWCNSIQKSAKMKPTNCFWNFISFLIIAHNAIAKNQKCEDITISPSNIPQDKIISTCNALKQENPEKCPWKETEREGILCRAVAERGKTNICHNLPSQRELNCCELFSWRFSNVASGRADSYVIPEMGAISGDTEGCTRALKWGLMKDLAPLFGLTLDEKIKKESPEALFSEYLCNMVIQWSGRKPPF